MVSTQTTAKTRASLNFVGQNLRGRNFSGQDLAGADFSGADIRGTRFTNANLTGAIFVGTKAGIDKHIFIVKLFIICTSLGFITYTHATYSSVNLKYLFDILNTEAPVIIHILILIPSQIIPLFLIGKYGLSYKTLNMIVLAASIPIALVFVLGGLDILLMTFSFAASLAGAYVGVSIVSILLAITIGGVLVGGDVIIGIFAILIGAALGFGGGVILLKDGMPIALASGSISISFLLGFHVSRQSNKGVAEFDYVRKIGLFFAALGGTSFSGAKLCYSDFSSAQLGNVSFGSSKNQTTNLDYVYWNGAQRFEKARFDSLTLKDIEIRELLVCRTGYGQSYEDADFHAANLNGVFLEKANLHRADLTDANCRDADLSHTTLTELQAIGTDFTGSTLTGACIENWNIDDTTCLNNITCDYIYLRNDLKLGFCERRPHNPDKTFKPGDFKKYVQDIQDTLQLLIRNGTTPDALRTALQELEHKHGITPDHIVETKRTGDNREDLLITFDPPHRVDKAAVEETADTTIAQQLEAAKQQARLEGKCEALEQQNQNLMAVLLKAQERPTNITIQQNQGDNASQSADSFTQNNSGGTNFQNQANDSTLNQGENINQNNGADTK